MCHSSILVSYMNFLSHLLFRKKYWPSFLLQVEACFIISLWLSASHVNAVSEDAFSFHQLFWCECVPAQDHVPLTAHDTAFSLPLSPFLFHAPHNPNNFSWSHWFYYDSTTPTRHPSQPLRPDSPTQGHPPPHVQSKNSPVHMLASPHTAWFTWWWRVADGDPRQTKLRTLVSVLFVS